MNAEMFAVNDVVADRERQLADAVDSGKSQRVILKQLEKLRAERQRLALGELSRIFDDYEFREGALVKARLKRRPKGIGELLNEPQWASLEELDLGSLDHQELHGKTGAFFNSLQKLQTVANLNSRLLPEVPCPRITTLSASQVDPDRLASLFPELRTLGFSYLTDPLRFWSHPFIESLDSVTVGALTWSNGTLTSRAHYLHGAFIEWVELGPPLVRLELEEDHLLGSGEKPRMQELFAAARRKGAEIVLKESPPMREYGRSSRPPHWSEDHW
jgi:hypothetical protein